MNSTQRRNSRRPKALETKLRIRAIKLGRGCKDCGYRQHAVALAFDHLPGTKKLFLLSKCGTKKHPSWKRIEAEIAKCDVVCHNCHAVREEIRRSKKENA